MENEQGNTKDELIRDVKAILTYGKMHKLKGNQRLTNRRQRRLWKAVDDPFRTVVDKYSRKVWARVERAILYGKEE